MYRIEAIPVGGGQAFIIADSSGARGNGSKMFVGDMAGTFDAVVPRTTYLNGPQMVHVPIVTRNYNQSGDMPLTVEYEFASSQAGIAACLRFWTALQTTCPVLADVIVSNGGARAVIPNVCLRPLSWRTRGDVSVTIVYPVRFGLIAQAGLSAAVPT